MEERGRNVMWRRILLLLLNWRDIRFTGITQTWPIYRMLIVIKVFDFVFRAFNCFLNNDNGDVQSKSAVLHFCIIVFTYFTTLTTKNFAQFRILRPFDVCCYEAFSSRASSIIESLPSLLVTILNEPLKPNHS